LAENSGTQILAIDIGEPVEQELLRVSAVVQLHKVTVDRFMEEFEHYADGRFGVILCQATTNPDVLMEIAQTCRNQCPQTPSFCISFDPATHQPKAYRKNGFTDAFLLPADRQLLVEALTKFLSPESLSKRTYKQIKVPDLKAGTKLGFDTYVFLPLNKKHIQFSGAAEEFSEKKAEKLSQHQMASIFIDQKDSAQFYEYVAKQFKNAGGSATEKAEKMQEAVRSVFSDIFEQTSGDFEAGRELLDSCRKVISTYVTGSSGKDYHTQLLKLLGGQRLEYSHSADVSTTAALFGMAIGYEKVDDLALSGFLHDLALATFPEEHGFDPDPKWTTELKDAYQAHPAKSLDLIKLKRIIISPEVEKIILQHHEKFNGTGFPKGLRGDRIVEGAQILCCADQFFYLTNPRPGEERCSPTRAFELIESNGAVAPALAKRIREAIIKKP
jgi:HD-GYP domain-containing protein (c-di-GMP phosphodiesterase class II)